MHKKMGTPLPVPTYPRLDRAKTGVFSIAAPAGDAANREHRRPASLWGTARRETRVIDASDAARQPKSPVGGSREVK